jgi:TP901-1 family phage major tail protein
MPPQKGLLFLLKSGDGADPEVFNTVAAQRSTSLSINGESVDVTNKDSAAQMRELMEGGGVKSMDISGEGVFTDDASQTELEDWALAGSIDNYQIEMEDGRIYEGPFQVTSVEYSGDHNGEQTYSVELESAGEITVTPSA